MDDLINDILNFDINKENEELKKYNHKYYKGTYYERNIRNIKEDTNRNLV